jgi:hypothetical protein
MYNIDETHCLAAMNAVLQANLQLMHATVEEALQPIIYGKKDTLGLDGIPESTIGNSLRQFDPDAVLITEEIGAANAGFFRPSRRGTRPTLYLSDPTDRSTALEKFLATQDPSKKVGEVVRTQESREVWEEKFEKPVSITGATSAISCVRYGLPISTAIVNFITQELFVAYRDGVFRLDLPPYEDLNPSSITLELLKTQGEQVYFRSLEQTGPSMERTHHFVTFLGKTGYLENFRDSDLIRADNVEKFLRYKEPGGPSRVLYLSTLQPEDQSVGFVLANGEKIGEWIHWLPMVLYGKTEGEPARHALRVYEIHQSRPWTKDGILMATPPPYSIFQELDGPDKKMAIDIEKFKLFSNPSKIRSTLLVAPESNTWAITVMERHLFREIELTGY